MQKKRPSVTTRASARGKNTNRSATAWHFDSIDWILFDYIFRPFQQLNYLKGSCWRPFSSPPRPDVFGEVVLCETFFSFCCGECLLTAAGAHHLDIFLSQWSHNSPTLHSLNPREQINSIEPFALTFSPSWVTFVFFFALGLNVWRSVRKCAEICCIC